MSNILEYIINVRDRATSTMQQLGGAAVGAANRLGGVKAESVLVSSALRELGAPINKLQQQLDKLKQERGLIHQRDVAQIRQFNTEIQRLERQISSLESTTSGSKIGGWAKDAFSQIPFAGLLTNPLVVAGTIAGAALKKGIEQDLNTSAFEVFLKSEEAAKQLNDDLGKIKMDKGALSSAAKQMLSQEVDKNDIIPLLSSMGDISGGQNDVLGSLSLAYSQVNSAGKLLGQELNQLINAGFNPLTQMSKTTGKSVSQLKEEMGKGLITSGMVKQAFIDATKEGGQYHGLLDKMANTLGGKWQSFQTKISDALIKVYEVLGPVAEKMLDLGGAALDATFNGLGWLFDKLKEGHPVAITVAIALGSLTASMMLMKTWGLIVAGVTKSITIAQWAWNAAMSANPIGLIIAGVIALIAFIGWLIYKVDGWGEAWDHTVNSAKSIWSGFINTAKFTWGVFYDLLMTGIEKLMIAWYKLKGAWGDDQAKQEISIIEKRSEERKQQLVDTGKQAAKDFSNAMASTKKAYGSFSVNDKSLGDFGNDLKSKLGISTPGSIAGAATIDSTINSNSSNKQGSATAVATGGTKHNYITINMSDLIGVLNINKAGFKETTQEMEEQATDALLRVLGSAVSAGN